MEALLFPEPLSPDCLAGITQKTILLNKTFSAESCLEQLLREQRISMSIKRQFYSIAIRMSVLDHTGVYIEMFHLAKEQFWKLTCFS